IRLFKYVLLIHYEAFFSNEQEEESIKEENELCYSEDDKYFENEINDGTINYETSTTQNERELPS
uniref:Uncharacterized protein n=1 Tax=Strongyloides papillosus TaxID=174720 RepID=A0A0N5BSC9_STREA